MDEGGGWSWWFFPPEDKIKDFVKKHF